MNTVSEYTAERGSGPAAPALSANQQRTLPKNAFPSKLLDAHFQDTKICPVIDSKALPRREQVNDVAVDNMTCMEVRVRSAKALPSKGAFAVQRVSVCLKCTVRTLQQAEDEHQGDANREVVHAVELRTL